MACGGHTVVCKKLLVLFSIVLMACRPPAITLPSVTLIVPSPSARRAQQGLGACPWTFLGKAMVLSSNANASRTAWRWLHRHIRAAPAFTPFIPCLNSLSHLPSSFTCVGER